MYYNFLGLDITMCFGKDCPLKNDCIRYVAKPEKYQSYFEESPYNDGKCDCFRDYREDVIALTKYVGEYSDELYNLVLNNSIKAKQIKKQIREITKN